MFMIYHGKKRQKNKKYLAPNGVTKPSKERAFLYKIVNILKKIAS